MGMLERLKYIKRQEAEGCGLTGKEYGSNDIKFDALLNKFETCVACEAVDKEKTIYLLFFWPLDRWDFVRRRPRPLSVSQPHITAFLESLS